MTQGLTDQQAAMLEVLRRSDRTPSYDELRTQLGLASKSSIGIVLEALEERGFIERIPGKARAIRVLPTPRPWDSVAPDLSEVTTDELSAELRRRHETRRAA